MEATLNLLESSFLDSWRRLDFTTWSEADIREDFIAPLLAVLGYSKGTVHDVLREESLTLTKPYHRVGRKRISIDYVPTVRLRKFWIIEAKPGTPRKMDFGDFLQAHLYAIHPEIRARYIVLTNGWEIRVYDAVSAEGWDDYLVCCTQENCLRTYPQLRKLLHVNHLTATLRQRALQDLKASLEVEVDERHVEDLRITIRDIIASAIPEIRENALELRLRAYQEALADEEREIANCASDILMVLLDNPIDMRFRLGSLTVKRLLDAQIEDRNRLITRLIQTYRGRPHNVFRVHTAHIMSRLFVQGIEVPSNLYLDSIRSGLEEVIRTNMTYAEQHPLINALCHLDNTILRVAKKLGTRLAMDTLTKLVELEKAALSDEDRVIREPTVAKRMISLVGLLAEKWWRSLSSLSSADEIWEAIWLLEELEGQLEAIPQMPYPDGDSDLLFWEYYGRGFDLLCVGTWDIVKRCFGNALRNDIPECVQRLLSMEREEVISAIPKPKPRPTDWKPTFRHQAILERLAGKPRNPN